jgi:chromosome partitioning protein
VRTIAICNQKGGVGKTTISVLLADAATRAGHRVLLVDLDPQANATETTRTGDVGDQTLADVPNDTRGASLARAIVPGSLGFDVAISSVGLASKEGNRRTADEHDLRRLLHPIDSVYDLVLIDSPPSLGVLTVNALTAANEYLVVTDPTKFAVDGIRGVSDTADVVRTYFNPDLAPAGVVVNLVDPTRETRPTPRRAACPASRRDARATRPTTRRREGSDSARTLPLGFRRGTRRERRLPGSRAAHRSDPGLPCSVRPHPPATPPPAPSASSAEVLAPFSTRLPHSHR